MSDYIFLFDMDSTITKVEVLPTIANEIGRLQEMRELTEATMRGELPFKTSFLERVKILGDISVKEVNEIVRNIPLNPNIVNFLKENSDRCYIITGNLDIWISGLMEKIGMENHCYCSKAEVENDKVKKVISVIDKELMAKQFVQPICTIGDGDNDSGIAKIAELSIGFGGVREIAPSLLQNINFAFYDDLKCAEFLRKLL